VLLVDLVPLEHPPPRLRRDGGCEEGPHLFAKGQVLGAEGQIHGHSLRASFRYAKLRFMPRVRRSMGKSEVASAPDRKFVGALGRGLDVLRCFGPRDRWLANQ